MRDDLATVFAALERLTSPVSCFVRDDVTGWDDARQLALLDVTKGARVPMDLAVIPAAIGDRLVVSLIDRIDGEDCRER